ncbi:hypothetical protein [Sphingobacterium suaedae]|uniref:Uncharacterized protein n=1 Tax=Sphingobacterium suaedae TaxID=1686402 RepID=A0ABW5KF74_9SPHI
MEHAILPLFIRSSPILTEGEKQQLAATAQPTDEEVDLIRTDPEIRDLLHAFIGDEHSRSTHLQLKAKSYLANGNVDMAWKVLLL